MISKIIFSATVLAAALSVSWLQNSIAQTEPVPPTDATVAGADNSTDGALPANIPPDGPLAQVIRLAQSGVEPSVILSYVNNSGATFNLTSDQIIYLKDLGLPGDVVTAMIQRDQQLGAATNPTPAPTAQPETPVQPVQVTQNYFYDTLSPYGGWVNVESYGLCWRPTVVVYDSNWQPYCDHGHWVYTDSGWYWLSDYSWGACTFHYGRWFHDARQGWCWWPDTTWGPSWVTWRYANDYCGWAPLPPRCVYRPGAGIFYNGVAVGAGFDFGISVNFFTFVPTRNFCDPHPRRYRATSAEATRIYNHTTVINNFTVNNRDHTFINNGIQPERISAVTKTKIPRLTIRDTTSLGARGEHVGGNTLVVNRPQIQANAVSSLNRGVKPPVVRQNITRPLINANSANPSSHQENQRPNNFSQPNHVQTQMVTPKQTITQPQIQRDIPRQSQEQNNMVAPVQRMTPANTFVPDQPTPNRGDDKHIMSPRQQQFDEQSRLPSRNSDRVVPDAPVERPQAAESRHDIQSSHSEPAPKESAPAASQKSDKDQNGPGH